LLAQCLATTVTGRDTTNTSWQTNADESDGMGFVPLPWDTPIDPSRLTRRGGSRTRDLLLLSRTLYQLSYQSKVFFFHAQATSTSCSARALTTFIPYLQSLVLHMLSVYVDSPSSTGLSHALYTMTFLSMMTIYQRWSMLSAEFFAAKHVPQHFRLASCEKQGEGVRMERDLNARYALVSAGAVLCSMQLLLPTTQFCFSSCWPCQPQQATRACE